MIVHSYSPHDGSTIGEVESTTHPEVLARVARATLAATELALTSPAERRSWLDAIAAGVEAAADELVAIADSETALGVTRLRGEVARMADQLRFYGRVAVDGAFLQVTIDEATTTTPRLVRVCRPLGPVAVFGSSNFPFGFGVLGNDVASAIAAGCPVVVKAHAAHLLTSLRLAAVAQEALLVAGAPEGVHEIVVGRQAGADLVAADGIRAVGFTGSQAGGLALWRIANERAEVIPVYAEMGTVNPVVLTRGGVADLGEFARGFVASFTLGSGQFCTKPGLLFAPAGHHVAEAVGAALEEATPRPIMLTEAIAASVGTDLDALITAGATVVTRVAGAGRGWSADAAVLSAPLSALHSDSQLLEECFGAVAVIVEYSDAEELKAGVHVLQGSLAGAVFGGDNDRDAASAVALLSDQVGRVTVGDWPTGVAWTWAQHHGGPWPATSDPRATSVGAAALDRFVRPVTYQSVRTDDLPFGARLAAATDNPWNIPRRINGKLIAP
jgi:NADP-dependent aldehyde dehydrogenase